PRLGAGQGEGGFEAGQVPRLGRRYERVRGRRSRTVQGPERDVHGARIRQRGVDLVDEHPDRVAFGEGGDGGQLVAGEHRPGRVVRVAQQVDVDVGAGQVGVEPVRVEPVRAVRGAGQGALHDP